jgi:peptidoglycan/xylan/chitin deacetylase (PgdA/CDA1 family)
VGGLGEIWIEAGRLIRGEVPWFVKAFGSRADGPVPVFIYHTIDPVVFEAHLLFLAENGYETWDADTYLEYLSGRTKGNPRAVVLTIDDARLSVWTHGFPLLRKYGARAVLFVIPGLTPDGPVRPHGSDRSEAGGRDDEIVNWSELEIMHLSGLVDVQSHSLYHNQVPRSPKVVGFLGSGTRIRPFDSIPVPHGYEDLPALPRREDLQGLPIFEGSSLFAGGSRYVPPGGFVEACLERASSLAEDGPGGEPADRVLERFGWPVERLAAEGSYTPVEGEIRDSLAKSRAVIESRLPGKKVRHFCFPYGTYSAGAVAELGPAGYSSGFLSYVRGRGENGPGTDPRGLVRVKNDYLLRLPGKGRRPLVSIIAMKAARRLKGETGY